jgi:hypothetical protein
MEAAASYPQCLGRDYPKTPDGTLLPLAWGVGTAIAPDYNRRSTYCPCRSGEPYGKASMVSAFVNGNTPAWNEQRSPEVKSYVDAMGEQIETSQWAGY